MSIFPICMHQRVLRRGHSLNQFTPHRMVFPCKSISYTEERCPLTQRCTRTPRKANESECRRASVDPAVLSLARIPLSSTEPFAPAPTSSHASLSGGRSPCDFAADQARHPVPTCRTEWRSAQARKVTPANLSVGRPGPRKHWGVIDTGEQRDATGGMTGVSSAKMG